jgi:polysaccharide biosynthesis/export protein
VSSPSPAVGTVLPLGSSTPAYVIEPPDILRVNLISNSTDATPPITGEHLVGPDGRVNLGTYCDVYLAGMTVEQARRAVEKHLSKFLDDPQIALDVFAYNSKTYYVITQGAGPGDSVQEFPITGNETVLDAIALMGGMSSLDSPKMYISRPARFDGKNATKETIMPVDWHEISRGGSTATNYQLMPRDRLIISTEPPTWATVSITAVIGTLSRLMQYRF